MVPDSGRGEPARTSERVAGQAKRVPETRRYPEQFSNRSGLQEEKSILISLPNVPYIMLQILLQILKFAQHVIPFLNFFGRKLPALGIRR